MHLLMRLFPQIWEANQAKIVIAAKMLLHSD